MYGYVSSIVTDRQTDRHTVELSDCCSAVQ